MWPASRPGPTHAPDDLHPALPGVSGRKDPEQLAEYSRAAELSAAAQPVRHQPRGAQRG
ncbi:MAG: hypothetical protein WKG07_33430 [Hymenobacter sp.]